MIPHQTQPSRWAASHQTAVCHSRTEADPVDFAWVLAAAERGLGALLSSSVCEVIASGTRRLLVLGLSNWPKGGVSATTLRSAQQPYRPRPAGGGRVVTPPMRLDSRADLEVALLDFFRRVLQDAGFTSFEAELADLSAAIAARVWPAEPPPRRRWWRRA